MIGDEERDIFLAGGILLAPTVCVLMRNKYYTVHTTYIVCPSALVLSIWTDGPDMNSAAVRGSW
jgi:hypothetical protein